MATWSQLGRTLDMLQKRTYFIDFVGFSGPLEPTAANLQLTWNQLGVNLGQPGANLKPTWNQLDPGPCLLYPGHWPLDPGPLDPGLWHPTWGPHLQKRKGANPYPDIFISI